MTLQEKRKIWRNKWRKLHPDKWKSCCKRYAISHKEKISSIHRKYVLGHKDKITAISRKYKKTHRVEILSAQKSYQKIRRKEDIQFRLSGNLRSRLGESIKNEVKKGSSVKDLGCSISQFKSYIESKWLDGMSWDNYGKHGWHLDHIVPLASFDLTDNDEIRSACHYTNYQPLWASDNIRKSNK